MGAGSRASGGGGGPQGGRSPGKLGRGSRASGERAGTAASARGGPQAGDSEGGLRRWRRPAWASLSPVGLAGPRPALGEGPRARG